MNSLQRTWNKYLYNRIVMSFFHSIFSNYSQISSKAAEKIHSMDIRYAPSDIVLAGSTE